MSHNKYSQAVRIYLPDIYTANETYGLYTLSLEGDVTVDSGVVTNITDTTGIVDGRFVQFSDGFTPDTFFQVLTHTATTITVDGVPDTSETGVTILQQSEFRWSENTLVGANVELIWTQGLITNNGISSVKEGADTRLGGCQANYDGINISLINAVQWRKFLDDNSICIEGCLAELYEFVGTETDNGLIEHGVVFTGEIGDLGGNENEFKIPIKNRYYKREAPMYDTVDEKIVPMTFGLLYSITTDNIGQMGKFIRTVNLKDESTYNNSYFDSSELYPDLVIFPVTGLAELPATAPCIRIDIHGMTTKSIDETPDDTYLIVTEGKGSGQIRKISRIYSAVNPTNHIYIDLESIHQTALEFPPIDNQSTPDQSWVKIVIIQREYACDFWPCKDLLDESGIALANDIRIYGIIDEKYQQLAPYGFDLLNVIDNHTIKIEGKGYTDNIDNLSSFVISPITSLSLQLEDEDDLNNWEVEGVIPNFGGTGNSWLKKCNGIFTSVPDDLDITSAGTFTHPEYAYDKNGSTRAEFHITVENLAEAANSYLKVFKFGLPPMPKNLKIDTVYLGIKSQSGILLGAPQGFQSWIDIILRRFSYTKSSEVIYKELNEDSANAELDDLPEFYTGIPVDYNRRFYRDLHGSNSHLLTDYTLFEFSGMTAEIYNTLVEGALLIKRIMYSQYQEYSDYSDFTELAIIFKCSDISVSDYFLSPVAGRMYGDEWGTRRDADTMIINPVDMVEHCKRLGNWQEVGEIKNWGKEYPDSPKIKVFSGEGSFDDVSMNTIKDYRPAFQLFEASEMTSKTIVDELCRTFGMFCYIDKDGYECVKSAVQEYPSIIYFTDLKGIPGDVIEPQVQDIFCEPFINYRYDYGLGKFTARISVTNIEADAWQASYTPGFTAEDGETVWTLCKALYNKYGHIEPAPSDFTDLKMVTVYADAVNILKAKLAWMDKSRIPISVNYALGRDLHIFQHKGISLPHQTANVQKECMIEEIEKIKNEDIVNLKLVILGDYPE